MGRFEEAKIEIGKARELDPLSKIISSIEGFVAFMARDYTTGIQKCQSVFGDKQDLMDGCHWFTNWLECADNPVVNYAQVSCPQVLPDRSGLPGR